MIAELILLIAVAFCFFMAGMAVVVWDRTDDAAKKRSWFITADAFLVGGLLMAVGVLFA